MTTLEAPLSSKIAPTEESEAPACSVIVATRNRHDDLERCLASILENRGVPFELIVVDQSDTPLTAIELEAFPGLRYFHRAGKGKSLALNFALDVARGSVLAFTDDDCTVPPDWLRIGVAALEGAPGVALAFGAMHPGEHDPNAQFIPSIDFPAARVVRGQPWRSLGLIGMGGNMFATRSLFARVGPFDEALGPGSTLQTGEECELAFRVLRSGMAIAQVPRLQVRHWGARDISTGDARRHILTGFFAIGAGYGKHLARRDPHAFTAIADEALRVSLRVGKAVALRHRPTHASRLAWFLRGVAAGWSIERRRRS